MTIKLLGWMVCSALNRFLPSFNLSLIDSYILDGQDPADFEVSYFLDAADALSPTTTESETIVIETSRHQYSNEYRTLTKDFYLNF